MGRRKKSVTIDDVMADMLSVAEKEYGKKGVFVSDDQMDYTDGVPIPDLAFQWLIDSNVLPLGRLFHVAGARQSCKSAFAYYLFDLFVQNGGGGILLDTESKTSPSLLSQMATDPSVAKKNYLYKPIKLMEDWMGALEIFVASIGKTTYGGDKRTPFLIILDSLSGSGSEELHEQLSKNGSPSSGYDRGTIKISKFMKAITSELTGLPICLLMTNHLKADLSDRFGYAKRTPGGTAIGLHTTHELWFSARSRLTKGPVPCGFMIQMHCVKNSMGSYDRKLLVPFRWEIHRAAVDEYGRKRRAWFDWDYALGNLCAELQEYDEFKDAFPVNVRGTGYSKRIQADALTGDDYIPLSEFGGLFRNNEELCKMFKDIFDMPNFTITTSGGQDGGSE